MLEARPSRPADISSLAPRLRKADLDELLAAGYGNAEAALMEGFLSPDGCTTVIRPDGEPIMMFGVAPHPHDDLIGCVWLLGTDDIARNGVTFLRHSRQFIDRFHEKYPVLMNFTDCRNAVHHRWLRWCGFMFINMVPGRGPGNHPFYEFVRVRN